MTRRVSRDVLRDLLTEIESKRPVSPGPHVADDDLLLSRWAAGYLSPEESARLTEHLSACRECAATVAAMIRSEAIDPPVEETAGSDGSETTESPGRTSVNSPPPPPSTRPPGDPSTGGSLEISPLTGRRRLWLGASLAVAASLLVAILYLGGGNGSVESQLAMADAELARGEDQEALARAEGVLKATLSSEQRTRALATAERAAEKVTVERLEKGQFDTVIDVARRVDRLGVASETLLNAELQAERKSSSQISLLGAPTLLDYGYDAVGQSMQKGFLNLDPKFERQSQAWQKALATHPGSKVLRLNYGQFLLDAGLSAQALAEFQKVLADDAHDTVARRGAALAHFSRQEYEEALRIIELILAEQTESPADLVNAAIVCEVLMRKDDAIRYWRQARVLETDSARRKAIDERLEAHGAK